jgi:putative membrane protein
VVNALMLCFTGWVAGRLEIGFGIESGFWHAFWGALVISLVSFTLSLVIRDED